MHGKRVVSSLCLYPGQTSARTSSGLLCGLNHALNQDEVRTQLYWGKVFSISSSITPLFLGIVIGAISSDAVLVKDGVSENGFLRNGSIRSL